MHPVHAFSNMGYQFTFASCHLPIHDPVPRCRAFIERIIDFVRSFIRPSVRPLFHLTFLSPCCAFLPSSLLTYVTYFCFRLIPISTSTPILKSTFINPSGNPSGISSENLFGESVLSLSRGEILLTPSRESFAGILRSDRIGNSPSFGSAILHPSGLAGPRLWNRMGWDEFFR